MGIRVPEKGTEAENTTLGQTTPGYIPREKLKKTHIDSPEKAKTKLGGHCRGLVGCGAGRAAGVSWRTPAASACLEHPPTSVSQVPRFLTTHSSHIPRIPSLGSPPKAQFQHQEYSSACFLYRERGPRAKRQHRSPLLQARSPPCKHPVFHTVPRTSQCESQTTNRCPQALTPVRRDDPVQQCPNSAQTWFPQNQTMSHLRGRSAILSQETLQHQEGKLLFWSPKGSDYF